MQSAALEIQESARRPCRGECTLSWSGQVRLPMCYRQDPAGHQLRTQSHAARDARPGDGISLSQAAGHRPPTAERGCAHSHRAGSS